MLARYRRADFILFKSPKNRMIYTRLQLYIYITREIERKYRRKNTIKRRRTSAQGESKCPLTIGARESSFRSIKPMSECLGDELINAARVSLF